MDAKVYWSEKQLERSKCFHVDVRKAFDAYSKVFLSTFIKPVLLKLKNEITHLDNFGSSIGSMMVIESREYKFQAFDYNDDTELVTLFRKVLAEMTKIIHQVTSFIMLDECMWWGYPSMEHTYTFEDYRYQVAKLFMQKIIIDSYLQKHIWGHPYQMLNTQ